MREQDLDFSQAWGKSVRQAESDYKSTEGGLKKLARKVLPSPGNTDPSHEEDDKEQANIKDIKAKPKDLETA